MRRRWFSSLQIDIDIWIWLDNMDKLEFWFGAVKLPRGLEGSLADTLDEFRLPGCLVLGFAHV